MLKDDMHVSASTSSVSAGVSLVSGQAGGRTWLLFPILLAAALCLSGCGQREIIPDPEALRCAHDILGQLDASRQSLLKNVASPGAKEYPVTLWVDMSASMYGFLTESDSKFRQVVKALTSRLSSNLEIEAIGTPRGGGSAIAKPQIRDLLDQVNYDRKDSDFGPVVRRFASQPTRIHLMLTDSVVWREGTLEHYGDLVRAANEALKPGGEFALLAFRGSYKGAYSSAILAGHPPPNAARTWYLVDYDTPRRPFTLWAVLPPGASIESIKKHLKAHSLEPDFELNLREGDILPKLAVEVPPQPGQRRSQKLLRDAQFVHSPDLESFLKASLITTLGEEGYVPLEFELDCSPKLQKTVGGDHAALVEWLNQNLVAELQCWELVRQRGGSFTNNPVPSTALDFRGRWQVLRSPAEGNVSAPEADKKSRLVFKVRKPTGGPSEPKLYAWVVTLRPSRGACDKLIPADYTTHDDSSPESADRILNLGPMMGTVATGTYVLGRVMAITEWR